MDDSKKLLKIIVILVVILIVYVGGCFGYKQAKFSPYEKSAEKFKDKLKDEAFRKENPNTTIEAARSDNLFTPSGLLTVIKDRVQLQIHPNLFGGYDTDVMLTDRFAGATVAQFTIDEKGEPIEAEARAKYEVYKDEIVAALKLANETFGKIYQIP